MPQRRATYRIVPVLLASLSAVAVILQGGAFPATAQVPVGTSTPLATGVASVAPSITMTVTATPVATVSPTLSPTVATSPSVTVTSTATVAPSASPALSATSGDPAQSVRTRKVDTSTVGNVAFVSIAQGVAYTCGLTSTDIAYCWGYNASGQLGDGSNTDRLTPTLVAVSGGLTFTTIAAGSEHTCAIQQANVGPSSVGRRSVSAGAAYCWGYNNAGQLGDGTTTDHNVPTAVDTTFTFSTISAGEGHTCAIQQANLGAVSVGRRSVSEAAAYCWGKNTNGQLGNATNVSSTLPVAVARNLSYTAIGAGFRHTCGITAAATYCWGWNVAGQLGDGTTSDRNTPILDDAPASSGGSSSAPEATAVPTRTAVPTATPVPLKYTWTRDANPASITVTSNRGYSRTIARATVDPVTGARTFKEWVRNSVTFDVYGVDENGLLVWADPSDTAIVSQIDWRQLLTMDMPAGAVDAIPVATPADGRLLWDVKGTGTIYVVGSDRFLHAIPDLRTFQASYTWANVIPITPTQLRLMPVGAPIPAVR
ncbi:MAG: hypothetical protein EBV53_06310 [Proteobacteria bacterium]|nr:hypothetical protein [Pseudomonadota bacterium]